jgi:hypothetical protein
MQINTFILTISSYILLKRRNIMEFQTKTAEQIEIDLIKAELDSLKDIVRYLEKQYLQWLRIKKNYSLEEVSIPSTMPPGAH